MDLGISEFGFALCGLAFAALVALLRPGSAGTVSRARLRVAAAAMVAWSAAAWWLTERASGQSWADLLPVVVVGIWLWQLEAISSGQGQPRALRLALRYSGVLVFAALAMAPAAPAPLRSLLGLALCVLGLFAIEQLYRNASAASESAMRWMGLGVGGLLVTELVIFAESLLTQPPGGVWQLRSYAYAMSAVAIYWGARKMPDWSFGLAVSRQVVFYASSIILVGGYLLLMSLVASIMVAQSADWSVPARLAFAAFAALILGLSMFARNLFRRLRVFISAHFYPHRYDYRAEWLRFTQTLAAADSGSVPERAIRAVAQIVSSQNGSLWRSDEAAQRYELSARWPVPGGETLSIDANDALPLYLAKSGWLIDLTELQTTPALYQDLKLDPAHYCCAGNALIVPLLHREQLYGWVVLDRPESLGALNFEDRDLLKIAGRQVAAHLAQFDADARLVQARQFETYNRMTAFVMHDLKNIAAQLRLISQNAERHRRNPEFVDDAFRTIASSAGRMTKLVSQLGSGTDTGTMQTVDLATVAERAALRCNGRAPVPQVVAKSRPVVFADMERLAAVIEHAIRNAQDATPLHGDVRVEIGGEDELPCLDIVDTGAGMELAFIRERLFRPFDTTKGTRGMGIGAFQIREYLTSLGGRVEVLSEPGRGTTMRLIFARTPAQTLALAAG